MIRWSLEFHIGIFWRNFSFEPSVGMMFCISRFELVVSPITELSLAKNGSVSGIVSSLPLRVSGFFVTVDIFLRFLVFLAAGFFVWMIFSWFSLSLSCSWSDSSSFCGRPLFFVSALAAGKKYGKLWKCLELFSKLTHFVLKDQHSCGKHQCRRNQLASRKLSPMLLELFQQLESLTKLNDVFGGALQRSRWCLCSKHYLCWFSEKINVNISLEL